MSVKTGGAKLGFIWGNAAEVVNTACPECGARWLDASRPIDGWIDVARCPACAKSGRMRDEFLRTGRRDRERERYRCRKSSGSQEP